MCDDVIIIWKRFGAEEAHWAHNPRVGGSKLPIARVVFAPLIDGANMGSGGVGEESYEGTLNKT